VVGVRGLPCSVLSQEVIVHGLAPMFSTQQMCLECWSVQGIFQLDCVYHAVVILNIPSDCSFAFIGDYSPVGPRIPAGSLVSRGLMDSKYDLSFEILWEAPESI
jgi:hypothetical protein